ncbi:hypothetical protein TRAPUB_837 [Trametes pubescens]|uniref:F-box domain-containing protein n=1 Tax=Trametes pubescens TaxID=154538 RepID=A0A1M2VL50_TRAPU|nr:hypothetical protein TRAPUB_837 [Trametes pubescens]
MDYSSMYVLNWDVLLHITAFLERCELSRLSKTCHALHAITLRQLLCDPIDLRVDTLLSFHAFLTGDATSPRVAFVRELIINCSLSRPRRRCKDSAENEDLVPATQILTAILRSTYRLKRLELDWAAAGLSSYLHDTVSALVHLEELRIPFVSQRLWDDLQGLRAPLRKLSMQLGPMRGSSVADPLPLLERFSSTLKEVSLASVQFKEGSIQYLGVDKLSLSDCYSDFLLGGIDTAPVSSAFPNITELSFSAARVHPEVSQWFEGRNCDKPELIERCRRTNKDRLKQDGGWQHLQRVRVGHVVDLYMLGLGGHVPHVEIGMLSESTFHMMQDVLRDTTPISLSLSLFAVDRILDCIPRLFCPDHATDGLSHCTLTLRCVKPTVDMDKLIAHLSELLAPLRVERLTVHLQRWDTVGIYYLPQEDLRPIDACLDRIYAQADDFAGRMMRGISSLRDVCVRVGHRETRRQGPLTR